MWIPRDLEGAWGAERRLPIRLVRGMRQTGKTSLLERLGPDRRTVSLDDVLARDLAGRDPGFFFVQHPPPLTIDEAQYAPALFPELKRLVDAARRERRRSPMPAGPLDVAWLTGSNQLLLESAVRESLAGRVSHFTLHTLSVHELTRAGVVAPDDVASLLLRGGWPELHVDPALDASAYLDDFLLTYVDKDIVSAAGIEKRGAFLHVLRLLAARTGQVQNAAESGSQAGVQTSTVLGWTDVLERMLVLRRLPPSSTNLHKRLTKTPKLYLMDTALAARLQGWTSLGPLLLSPQAGPLFETLVFGEIVRAVDHGRLAFDVHLWRTRDGEEVDFLLTGGGRALALDAKLAVHGVRPTPVPRALATAFPELDRLVLVTLGGERRRLSPGCEQVPIASLHELLVDTFGQPA